MAVFMAVLKPGETVLGMSLAHGGHLTHGTKVSFSGKLYNAIAYGVRRDTELIDYDEMRALAREHKPKLIIAGASAYPRTMDYEPFREIADEVGAVLMVDMAHIAGLVAVGLHPVAGAARRIRDLDDAQDAARPARRLRASPTKRTPRALDKSVFPGHPRRPADAHDRGQSRRVPRSAAAGVRRLSAASAGQRAGDGRGTAARRACGSSAGGTDTHLLLVDLSPKNLTGKAVEAYLDEIAVTVNKNAIPFDTQKPMVASGIRIGSPAITSRGFDEAHAREVGKIIGEALGDIEARQRIAGIARARRRANPSVRRSVMPCAR